MPVIVNPLIPKLPFPFVIARALPPSELSRNNVFPPIPPKLPALLMIVALLAVDVSPNSVMPPAAPLTVPPLLVIAALPAVDAISKWVIPPAAPLAVAPLLVIDCVFPEVFTIPPPSIVGTFPFVLTMKAFAPGSKLMLAAVMLLRSVAVPPTEPRKCATLVSTQLAAVFEVDVELHEKNPEVSGVTQVPLPATAGVEPLPVQNRSTLQAFGSTLKVIRAMMSAAKMPGSLFGGRVATLWLGCPQISCCCRTNGVSLESYEPIQGRQIRERPYLERSGQESAAWSCGHAAFDG